MKYNIDYLDENFEIVNIKRILEFLLYETPS